MEIRRPDTPACTIPNTTEPQSEDHEMPDAREPSNPFADNNVLSPSASLETLLNDNIQYSPDISHTSTPTPGSQLHALIQAERFPPGQRAMFEAIDALRAQLGVEDARMGLRMALDLLRETLAEAINYPSKITETHHLRTKLRKEYDALPEEVAFGDLAEKDMVAQLKEWVGRRWAIEAMGGPVEFVQLM